MAADLAAPINHPEWATEFFAGPASENDDGSVSVSVPMMGGPARMNIEADVDRGIIDVYLAPDQVPFGDPIPVRLVPNGDGVDVLWTLGRPDGIPDPAWQQGLDSMARELANLKARHENHR
ncbi:MAG: hypothetical protein ACE5GB_12715 [Acidimicrobiales bacterium]